MFMIPVMLDKQIPLVVVMGVGNILLRDEGVGVRALQRLEAEYDFAANVELVDGGVQALNLLAVLDRADKLILLDAVRGGAQPGGLHVFDWDEIPPRINYKDSIHQVDFVETMSVMAFAGNPPQTTVVGVEPLSIEDWDLELSPPVAASLDQVVEATLKLLDQLGFPARLKQTPGPKAAI